jgi:hypothetical protein
MPGVCANAALLSSIAVNAKRIAIILQYNRAILLPVRSALTFAGDMR